MWVGDQLLSETVTDAGATVTETRDFLYPPGSWSPLAQRISGSVFCCHTDHRGAPTRLTDDKGHLAWSAAYTAFGQAHPRHSRLRQPLRLPGQYHDEETGLHQNRWRFYDPQRGRYLSPDPLGLAGGLNLYAYAGNDPVGQSDPLGLFPSITDLASQVFGSRPASDPGGSPGGGRLPWKRQSFPAAGGPPGPGGGWVRAVSCWSTELRCTPPAAKRVTMLSMAVSVSAFHKTSCKRRERKIMPALRPDQARGACSKLALAQADLLSGAGDFVLGGVNDQGADTENAGAVNTVAPEQGEKRERIAEAKSGDSEASRLGEAVSEEAVSEEAVHKVCPFWKSVFVLGSSFHEKHFILQSGCT